MMLISIFKIKKIPTKFLDLTKNNQINCSVPSPFLKSILEELQEPQESQVSRTQLF